MAEGRRIREQRAIYSRFPDNGLRVNNPMGYPSDYLPVPQPTQAEEVDGIGGAWWYGQGDGPRSSTTGSPLTERSNPSRGELTASSWLPAITRCLSVIVETVVRTRWMYRDSQEQVLRRPLWVHDPMLQQGSPGPISALLPAGRQIDGHSFFSGLLSDAILWGRGGFVFAEANDRSPLPGSLALLNPFQFNIAEDGHVVLDPYGEAPLRTDFGGRFQMNGQTWRVAVLPGQYPNHEGWPQGVLLRHYATFRLGARITGYLDNLYTSGVPSGYLSVQAPNFGTVAVEDPDRPGEMIREDQLLKREWMCAHGQGLRSVAVLNSLVSYTPVSINPVDAEVAKLSSLSRTDIAHAFGLSSVFLDEGMSGLNYSNSSERRADLVSMTCAGWGEKICMLIASLMPYGSTVQVLWPSFIQPSTETLMPAIVQAVQAGIVTAREARQLLGSEPWIGPDPAFVDHSLAASPLQQAPASQPQPTPTIEEVTP
jgi:hypothetical protein